MNIKNRIAKLETNNSLKQCLCGKTFVDLFHREPGLSALKPCPQCREQFEFWAKLTADAKTKTENLTDAA